MKPENEMQGLLRFVQAVERGKELHPGPFTIHQFYSDVMSEVAELVEAYNQVLSGIQPLTRVTEEAIDVAVVAHRFANHLRKIEEKKAMEFDPG